jgi:O-antigen/teichoic acid export membrane protein
VGILYSTLIVRSLFAIILTSAIWYRVQCSFSFAVCKDIIRFSLPIILSRLGSSIVKQSDKYFVLLFISIADMGIYSLSLRFGNIIHQLLTVPFNLVYIPRRFEIMNRDHAGEVYSRIFTYYIFLVVFVGLAISMLIPEILTLMVTPRFMKAKEIIPFVVLSMIIFGSHFHFDFGILYSKKTEHLAYINLSCAVMQVALNILLIPKFGVQGAVWSSIIVFGPEAIALYFVSKRSFDIPYQFSRVLAYCGLAAGFYGISTFIHAGSQWIDCLLKLLLLAAFPVSAVIFRIITKEEKQKFIRILISKLLPASLKPVSISNI